MGRIHVLSDNVANKIAAGEVVERPASVVKELLENCLDAGSTDIRVDTESAGRRLIRIADNGHGMMRDDALLAFERHATSKLSDVKDLLAIGTLGFRGEALPSIASVSRLLLETRSADEQTGTVVEFAGGKLLRCEEMARDCGTTITVRDLFYNVPARKKFLRSDQTELSHIGSLVTHYSLAHPGKRFALTHDGREILQVTPVTHFRDRALQVFGEDVLSDVIDIGVRSRDLKLPPPFIPPNQRETAPVPEPEFTAFQLEGLVSGPHVQKLNRNSVFLFVNGRLIRDKVLIHAISAAFQNLMPPGSYPFALLFLTCDPGQVDVNVHPAKTEVRFRNSSFVHDFVRDGVREALIAARPVSSMPVLPESPRWSPPPPSPGAYSRSFVPQGAAALPFSEFSTLMESAPAPFPPDAVLELETQPAAGDTRFLPEIVIPAAPLPGSSPQSPSAASPIAAAPLRSRRVPDTHGALATLPSEWEAADTLASLPDLRALGQLHESFIVAAGRDGLWIIDQHVAHERILFEKVLREQARGTPRLQRLLMPLILHLSVAQQLEFDRISSQLTAAGFEVEPFGQRTIAVTAAPADLSTAQVEPVLFELLEIAEEELRSASFEEVRRNIAATIACRAAIKINMHLEPQKIEWLLKSLAECEYPMTCPHGRPISLRYGTKDILRSFHRI